MSALMTRKMPVGKKRQDGAEKKPHGTMIRVSAEFAEMIGKASSFEGKSVSEFAAEHLQPIVEKRYREAVLKEAKRLEAKD